MSMPLSKRPTIVDVAAKAGVSKSLVSLAYTSPSSVSELRREKIAKAANDLGFMPNIIASALSAQRSKIIGILVGDLHNPLFMDIAERVRQTLEAQGQTIFLTSTAKKNSSNEIVPDEEALRSLGSLPLDALLIIGTIPDSKELKLISSKTRVVYASAVANRGVKASSIRVDEEIAMDEVVSHLKSLGHKRIGFISWSKSGVAEFRRVAYENAMRKFKLNTGIHEVITVDATEAGGFEAARELLENSQSTAVIAFNDLLGYGVQKYLFENGRDDVAVIGFDNTFVSELHQVSLTSIDQGNAEIAALAVELLRSEKLNNKRLLSKPRLIVRKSSQAKRVKVAK